MDKQEVLQLLSSYVQLIDIISPRGAFKGEELLNVGALRQKTIDVVQALEQELAPSEDSVALSDAPTDLK